MWITFLATVFFVYPAECKIGNSCLDDYSCSYSSTSFVAHEEICNEGVCRCNPEIEVRYSDSLQPSCSASLHVALQLVAEPCNDTSCGENLNCVERQAVNPYEKDNVTLCVCKEGFLRLDDACRVAAPQKVLQPCYIPDTGPLRSCDPDMNTICESGQCVCFENYFANTTSGNCEPVEKYKKIYNLTEYRVKPEEYCRTSDHCLEGLNCDNFMCACPPPCTYNSTEEICDCGIVEEDGPEGIIGPIIVGILLGLLIVVWWIYKIQNTISRFTAQHEFIQLVDGSPTPNQSQIPSPENPTGPPTISGTMNQKGAPVYGPPMMPNQNPGYGAPQNVTYPTYMPPNASFQNSFPANGAGYNQFIGPMQPVYDTQKQVSPIGSFPDAPEPPPYEERAPVMPRISSSNSSQREESFTAEPLSEDIGRAPRRTSASSKLSLSERLQSANFSSHPIDNELRPLNSESGVSEDSLSKRAVSASLGSSRMHDPNDTPKVSI